MPRPAFQITVNGKRFCESEEVNTVTMVSEPVPRTDRMRISVHASVGEGDLHWLEAGLAIVDEIVVRIVDADTAEADPLRCHFCGSDPCDVSRMVMNASTAICDRCVSSFSAAIKGEAA